MEPELTAEDLQRDFESVVRRFQKPLVNFIWRMVGNEETAMDLTQDVFVKAYNARGGFDGRSRLSTWLFAIAANHARDYLKRPKLVVGGEKEDASLSAASMEAEDSDMQPEKALMNGELRRTLDNAMKKLPPDYREVIVMRHVNGMAVNDIAAALGIPEGTVKVRLFRGRERMQAMLTETLGQD